MSALEYRVAWRREGAPRRSTVIYQRGESAMRKASRILAMERLDREGTTFATMPALAEGPTIEVRAVDEWAPNVTQVTEPSTGDLEGMASWLDGHRVGGDSGPVF